mgnify:CR=1 FL=1
MHHFSLLVSSSFIRIACITPRPSSWTRGRMLLFLLGLRLCRPSDFIQVFTFVFAPLLRDNSLMLEEKTVHDSIIKFKKALKGDDELALMASFDICADQLDDDQFDDFMEDVVTDEVFDRLLCAQENASPLNDLDRYYRSL